jgi:hypothetical protein
MSAEGRVGRGAVLVAGFLALAGSARQAESQTMCSATYCTPTRPCATACRTLDEPGPPPTYVSSTCGDEGYTCGVPACSPFGSNPGAAIDCKIATLSWSACSPAPGAAPAVLSVHASNDGAYKDCAQGRVVWHVNAARAIVKASGGASSGIWGKWTSQSAVRSAVGYPIADTQGGTRQQFQYGHLLLAGSTASGTAYIAGGQSMPAPERAALLALAPTAPTVSPSDTTPTSAAGGGWGFGAIGSSSKPIWVVRGGAAVGFKIGGAGANAIVDRWNAENNVSGPLGWPLSSTLPLTGDGTLETGSAGMACGQNWSTGTGYYNAFWGGHVYWKEGGSAAYTVPPGVIQAYWFWGRLANQQQSCGEAGPLGWPASNQTNARNAIYPKAQLFQRGSARTYLVATGPSTLFEMMPAVYDYWTSVTGGASGWLGMPVANWDLHHAEAGQRFERGTVFFSSDQSMVFGVEGEPRSACLARYLSLGGAVSSGLGHPLGNNGFEGTAVYPQTGTLRKQLFQHGYLVALSATLCVGSYAPTEAVAAIHARRGVFNKDNPALSEVLHVRPNEPAPWATPYDHPEVSREHRYFPTVKLEFTPVAAPETVIERSTRGPGPGGNWGEVRTILDSEGVLQPGVPFTFTDSWQTSRPGTDNALAFPGENCYRVVVRGTGGHGNNVALPSSEACVATRGPVINNSPQFSGSMTVQPLKRLQLKLWGWAGSPASGPITIPSYQQYSWLRVELQHRPEGFGDDDLAARFPVGNSTIFSPWYVGEAGTAGMAFDLKLDSARSAAEYIEDFRDVTRLKLSHPEAGRPDDHCNIPGGCAGSVLGFCVTKLQLVSNEIRTAGACPGGALTCTNPVGGSGAVHPGEVLFERDYGVCRWVGTHDGAGDPSSSTIEIGYRELHGDWERRHPPAGEEYAHTQPTQGGRVRRWFAPYGAAGIHGEMLREQIETAFMDGLFRTGVSGQNYPANSHDLTRYLDGPHPVTQYWVDRHTTIFKVRIKDYGAGTCGGDRHASIYLRLHTDGTTGTTDEPGNITVDPEVGGSGDICDNLGAGVVYGFSFLLQYLIPGIDGPVDLIAAETEKIKKEVEALAQDRQAPASPIPLNLLFCCNGNIEVNCCSGDNSACADRPFLDLNLPPASTELPLLCSDLP